MATSAFKSTTRRAPMGISSPSTDDSALSSSSKAHHRSRSLSRFSRPVRTELQPDVVPTPRRKFVNTVRGTDFPEISLDDLALDFFPVKDNSSEVDDDRGSSRSSRLTSRNSEISPVTTTSQRRSRSVSRRDSGATAAIAGGTSRPASSQRRGRSVSRRNDGTPVIAGGTTRDVPEAKSRRRRSVSVARYHISDSESDIDPSRSSASRTTLKSINNGNSPIASFQKSTASSHQRSGRSMSQKPLLRWHNGYSSRTSTLTDDESRDAPYGKSEIEKTIRAVYAQKKIDHPIGDDVNHGLYEAMRRELRSAVNEIMIELEQAMERKPSAFPVHDRLHTNKSDVLQMVSAIRKKHAKLKQPEKHRQDVSDGMALEDQQGKDGSKIVREVLPDSKRNAISHSRKRSNDRNMASERLTEEAEKYFKDFISNVEDTDFSSFEGERSDTSSTLGGTTMRVNGALSSQNTSPAGCNSLPVGTEDINLPWLKWDSNDVSPLTSQNTTQPCRKLHCGIPTQDLNLMQEPSHESWNPELADSHSTNRGGKASEIKNHRRPGFDVGRYVELQRNEELLFDSWRQRRWISSGGLLLCGNVL